ncbi:MAG: hypothetical protein FWF08_03935, partial [Oscillospiraceae bacterium]|nr:hypothetical protein [Oscillospiraceae bacterium]
MKKALNILVVLALLVTTAGYSSAVEETTYYDERNVQVMDDFQYEEAEPQIMWEDYSKRGEFEKHFLQSDGSYIAVSYAEQVHRQTEDGTFKEIDNTLQLKNGRLENADEEFKVSFAEKSDGKLVELTSGGYA